MNVMNESTILRHAASGDSVQDLFELLRVSTFRGPNALAIDFLGRKLTYRDVFQAVEHVAGGLKDIGVSRGDRVALSLPNTPYSVIFFFAVQRVGGIVVNLNPLYVQHEVHQILKTVDVSVLVISDLAVIAEPTYRAAENTSVRRVVVCPFAHALPPVKSAMFKVLKSKDIYHFPADKRLVAYDTLAHSKTVAPHVTIDPLHDVAVLQFTGGTTGVPKAARLTHGNLLANIEQVKDMAEDALREPPTTLGILPLFHVFALMAVMLLTIERGGEIVLLPRFETQSTLVTMRRVRITLLPTVPTIQTALLRDPALSPELFTHMRAIISGGAPLPVALRKRFEDTARCPVIEGYGLSETSPVLTLNPLHGVRDGSCGKVVLHTDLQIRSLDDITRRLPVMEKGEVCVKGPQVMSGYWNNEENASAFTPDGYFRTGDVGYLDQDGYLFLVDRLKDIIICGGYNVYPHVIEEALHRHPAVLEALVIGVPDPYRGQTPKAFVTLRPDSTTTPADLATHLEQFISKIERPREIVLRDSLPKTLIGKLSRKDLKIQEGITT